jgi:hypothetical protein
MYDNEERLDEWLSALTRAGYDPDGASCYTARGDWNGNHPINSLNMCFRRDKSPDIVMSSYSCHGSVQRTTYLRVCYPNSKRAKYQAHMAFGFEVKGTDKTERTARTIKDMLEMIELKSPPPHKEGD